MGNWLTDLRYTFRSLSKSPGYTAVALLTIALGIGANSAIFSVVNSVLLKPLEYEAPNRLVMLHTQFPTMGFDKFWVSAPEYREFREWNQSFTEVAIYNVGLSSLQANDQPVRVSSGRATAEFFDVPRCRRSARARVCRRGRSSRERRRRGLVARALDAGLRRRFRHRGSADPGRRRAPARSLGSCRRVSISTTTASSSGYR